MAVSWTVFGMTIWVFKASSLLGHTGCRESQVRNNWTIRNGQDSVLRNFGTQHLLIFSTFIWFQRNQRLMSLLTQVAGKGLNPNKGEAGMVKVLVLVIENTFGGLQASLQLFRYSVTK